MCLPSLSAILLFCLSGCGYSAIRPDAGGPVEQLRLGVVTDTSAEGDLGVRASHGIRTGLAGRRPAVGKTGPRMTGEIRLGEPKALTGDASGFGSSYGVELTLALQLHDDDRLVWASGPVRRRAVYLRGPNPYESDANRRSAIEQTLDRAVADAVDRLIATPKGSP